jgi:hypothetical protein
MSGETADASGLLGYGSELKISWNAARCSRPEAAGRERFFLRPNDHLASGFRNRHPGLRFGGLVQRLGELAQVFVLFLRGVHGQGAIGVLR